MRKRYIKISLTELENAIIRKKASDMGIKVTEYLRGLALNYKISYKLSPSELEAYMALAQFSNHFRVIHKLLKDKDYAEASENAISTSKEIREHLMALKK